jgi:hypothetical protein
MKLNLIVDSILSENKVPELDLQRYKLYIDLNDMYLRCILRKQKIDDDKTAKANLKTVEYVLFKYHTDIYNDLSSDEVKKVKALFKKDFEEKKNMEYALGGLDKFVEHLNVK